MARRGGSRVGHHAALAPDAQPGPTALAALGCASLRSLAPLTRARRKPLKQQLAHVQHGRNRVGEHDDAAVDARPMARDDSHARVGLVREKVKRVLDIEAGVAGRACQDTQPDVERCGFRHNGGNPTSRALFEKQVASLRADSVFSGS